MAHHELGTGLGWPVAGSVTATQDAGASTEWPWAVRSSELASSSRCHRDNVDSSWACGKDYVSSYLTSIFFQDSEHPDNYHLPQLIKSCIHISVLFWVFFVLGIKPRVSCYLGSHGSPPWADPQAIHFPRRDWDLGLGKVKIAVWKGRKWMFWWRNLINRCIQMTKVKNEQWKATLAGGRLGMMGWGWTATVPLSPLLPIVWV